MSDVIDLRLWGKSRELDEPYALVWHMVDAAAMASVLWELFLTGEQRRFIAGQLGVAVDHAGRLLAFWAALHDLGKVTPSFQEQDLRAFAVSGHPDFPPSPVSDRIAHAVASQFAVGPMLESIGYSRAGRPVKSPLCRVAQILGGHHGRFEPARPDVQVDPLTSMPELGRHGWAHQRELLFRQMHDLSGRPAAPERVPSPVAELATGVIILADWLVSQAGFIRARQSQLGADADPVAQFELARAASVDAFHMAALGTPRLARKGFAETFGYEPNALQRSILDELPGAVSSPGLLVVTAATGDGKTEAALTAAEIMGVASGASGLFFALPTMATSDQMYRRVAAYLDRRSEQDTPLTLLHSMSWLNADYEGRTRAGLATADERVSSDDEGADRAAVMVSAWLRAAKRGLLAPFATGTIDQALLAALPVKHNVLRLLGLAGKVLIVDEAHAYDAYMQALLRRLLTWLGSFHCPVILLSATLPSTVSSTLVRAYLAGSLGRRNLPSVEIDVPYPGWLYVDGTTAAVTRVSEPAARQIQRHRAYPLHVEMRMVTHPAPDLERRSHAAPPAGSRMAAIHEVMSPLLSGEGCAAIVCNTVADAQATYLSLRAWLASRGPDQPNVDLHLLHARLPAAERERRTAELEARYGKQESGRPRRIRSGIVVATQVIEQSLDLDFDLVISDIAPIALLLQRAGRCFRHANTQRPGWATGARIVVLDPLRPNRSNLAPAHWGSVYSPYLLRATHDVLTGRDAACIQVPYDVQGLVEKVYVSSGTGHASDFTSDAVLSDLNIAHEGERMAQEGIAAMIQIPEPPVGDLSVLSDPRVDEIAVSTRLGADTVRVVCCYADDAGTLWLDPGHSRQMPGATGATSRIGKEDVRAILGSSIPVDATWLRDGGDSLTPPQAWQDNSWLRDVRVLPHRLGPDGTQSIQIGNRAIYLDPELGLVRR